MGKVLKKIASLKQRMDAWQNVVTGLGTSMDKRVSAQANWVKLNETDAEELYSGDDQARKANDLLPKDMVREGFKIISPDLDEEKLAEIYTKLSDLDWKFKVGGALSWARLYGGAGLILGIGDGVPPEKLKEPLDENNIDDITFMNVVSRWELQPKAITSDPQNPNFGLPEVYTLQPHAVGNTQSHGAVDIHHSRLIRFDGYPLPRRKFIDNNYWGDSLMGMMKNALGNYNAAYDSVAVLMNDFSQSIFKIRDLADIVSTEEGAEMIEKRVAMVEQARSMIRATIIDAQDEDWKRDTVRMDGIAEILVRLERRLVQASGYPHTVFLGEEPGGGFGHTGKSEQRDYYDYVSREQEEKLHSNLTRLVHLIFISKNGPTNGVEPEKWLIEFNPLWQDDQGELVDRKLKQSQADTNYINTGVLDPSEVAKSRFGSGEFNHETTLDSDIDRSRGPEDFENPLDEPGDDPLKGGDPRPPESRQDSDNGNLEAPRKRKGHYHSFIIKDGYRGSGYTGDPHDMGNGTHFHNTQYGPTSLAPNDGEHTHEVARLPEGVENKLSGPRGM